jgi:HTH-type transcriptional regulator/antitoxin HigA
MTTPATKTRNLTKRRAAAGPTGSYLALVREFPLRPIRGKKEYEQAAAVLDALAVRPEGTLDAGEQDYLDTLTLLVRAHDDEHHEMKSGAGDALSRLKYLMEESGMRTIDLGRVLGNRGLASLILNGRRQLSKTHIRKLSEHFKVSPALFLGP